MASAPGLLAGDEPPAVYTLRENGRSPFLLVCDHAGQRLPQQLGSLGLSDRELQRHIAWDIGAAGVVRLMADALDAVAVLQTYSRLVIDCNRAPSVPSSIVELSEHTEVPGNQSLSPADRHMRVNEIFRPYHDRIGSELDRRAENNLPTALVAVHSFTPVFKGVSRPWHVGMLYNRDARMAKSMLAHLGRDGDLVVGDNQPYAITDESDYTIPVHGEQRGLPHVEIEVRQDIIADAAGQRWWADRLVQALTATWKAISP